MKIDVFTHVQPERYGKAIYKQSDKFMTDKNAADLIGAAAAKTSSNMLMLEGVVLIVLGTIAILVPVIFTLAVETLVGAVLVIGGLVAPQADQGV